MARERSSDRWITPGVVIAFLIVGGLVVAGLMGAVTWLTARGIDASPIIDLVVQATAAVGALGTLVLQLAGRSTAAKTERNTGVLASNVGEVLSTLPPAPPAPEPPTGVAAAPGSWGLVRS